MHVINEYTMCATYTVQVRHSGLHICCVHMHCAAEELASLRMEFHVCVSCREKILQAPSEETGHGWVEDGVVQV